MKFTLIQFCLLFAVLTNLGHLCAQEADAAFKAGVAQIYKQWMEEHIFTCAYQVREKETQGEAVSQSESEFRLTLEPATQRFVFEMHRLPSPGNPKGTYAFYRWNGTVMALGTSNIARAVQVDGRPAVHLADVPLGTPLCTKVTLYGALLNCNPIEDAKVAAGFTFEGQPLHQRLENLLKDPHAQLLHLPDTPAEDISLILGDRRVIFDARLGLVKGTEVHVKEGRAVSWSVERFVDRMPAHMVLKMAPYGLLPEREMIFEALPDQCRRLEAREFSDLLAQPLPPDMEITDLSDRGKPGPKK